MAAFMFLLAAFALAAAAEDRVLMEAESSPATRGLPRGWAQVCAVRSGGAPLLERCPPVAGLPCA